MELTRDKIEWLAKQPIISEFVKIRSGEVAELAKQLLAEMDKTSVWTDAPDEAGYAYVIYYIKKENGVGSVGSKEYTRELPKSRERQIADEVAKEITQDKYSVDRLSGVIKSAILQARKEWEAER